MSNWPSTNSEFLDLAHTVHILLVILGEARSRRINSTVDIIVGILIHNAIEAIFRLGDLGRRAPELIFVGYTVAIHDLWSISHNTVCVTVS